MIASFKVGTYAHGLGLRSTNSRFREQFVDTCLGGRTNLLEFDSNAFFWNSYGETVGKVPPLVCTKYPLIVKLTGLYYSEGNGSESSAHSKHGQPEF